MADINNLANLNKNNGIFQIATDNEIYLALIKAFMDIYGDDIVISEADADGQYVAMETNILRNIYALLNNMYKQHTIGSATGKYLDALCALSNVFRKQKSYSKCNIYVKNTNNTDFNDKVVVVDRNGVTWRSEENVSIVHDNFSEVLVVCDSLGPVNAIGNFISSPSDIVWDDPNFLNTNGDIYKTVENNGLLVYQSLNAIVGNNEETDDELRARRLNVNNITSVTFENGLKSKLELLDGVQEVYIKNNASSASSTEIDSVVVDSHNVYCVVKYKDGYADEFNDIVGKTIYENMTPGVYTQSYSGSISSGTLSSYNYNIISNVYTTVYWKKAAAIKPTITINFNYNPKYIVSTEDAFTESEIAIIEALENIFANLRFTETLNYNLISNDLNMIDGIKYVINVSAATPETTDPYSLVQHQVNSNEYINIGILPKLCYIKYLVLNSVNNQTNYHFSYNTAIYRGTLVINSTSSSIRGN